MSKAICHQIAQELNVRPEQVIAAVTLIDDGNTVPFIARYRKEVTGGLDDTQLRNLDSRLAYLREMDDRRQTILKSIQEQGKLTLSWSRRFKCRQQNRLEDLYLPYKPKRRTKGQIAIEAGLEPLADTLWTKPNTDPESEAAKYINAEKGVADSKAALDGARAIVMERIAEDANLLEKSVSTSIATRKLYRAWSKVKNKRAKNLKITLITANRSAKRRHIAHWLCCVAVMRAS